MIKIVKIIGVVLFVLVGGAVLFNYHPDISVERLKDKYTYPDSRFVTVEGMDVHYRSTGQGPVLLLLHGTGASLHTWEIWTKELQDSFTVISLDLPAFGLTGPFPNREYSITHYSNFINLFSQAIEIDSFALGGNSLGGLIAWKFASDYPTKVKELILLDAAGIPKAENGETPLAFRLAKNPVLATIMQKVTPKSLFRKSLHEVYGDPAKVTPELLQRYFELFRRPGNRQAYVDRINQNEARIDPGLLKKIRQPTLILWGENDEWIPVEHANVFSELLPNDAVIIYPGVGHLPMEEIPAQTAKDVRNFLMLHQMPTLKEAIPSAID